MQTPSASDPSFKVFLDKLKEQNDRGFLTQLLQLKSEREIAGEDNDKREEQLDEVISSLKEVRVAVTGVSLDVDITPLVNIGENQTRLLEELSKESALSRKLTEGSVEYDKEAAQYRNTSGREIESLVTGKVSKKGGFIDFETARDSVSGQGKRVREANQISLKPINYVPGKSTATATNSITNTTNTNTPDNKTESRSILKYLGDEIESGIKYYLSQGLSAQSGDDMWQKPKDIEKKERAAKVSSDRQKPVSTNPESDNIVTSQEAIAEVSKSDLEVSNQLLDVTKSQLIELKSIREALAPKTPDELTSQRSAPSFSNEVSPSSVNLSGIPGFNLSRRTPTGPGAPSNKKPRGKVPTSKIPGGASKLGMGLKIGGGLLAGAGLALGAYEASEFLGETGYGDRMAEGAGQSAEKAFRENVAPTIDPVKAGVTKEQAVAALENGSPRDIEKLGGRDALMKIAGLTPVVGVSTEQAAAARSNYASVDPRRVDTAGKTVASTSTENVDMGREHLRGGGGSGNTVISNNVNNSSTTKYVPMKASPRPEHTGSALDRYQDRITAY
jgi:hypothetical protein